jgi:hypothetical protein
MTAALIEAFHLINSFKIINEISRQGIAAIFDLNNNINEITSFSIFFVYSCYFRHFINGGLSGHGNCRLRKSNRYFSKIKFSIRNVNDLAMVWRFSEMHRSITKETL